MSRHSITSSARATSRRRAAADVSNFLYGVEINGVDDLIRVHDCEPDRSQC